ncbi:MAG: hypothetical protein ACI9UN_002265 [Granulosicoccus sp.]|jgi:hypothetical protein
MINVPDAELPESQVLRINTSGWACLDAILTPAGLLLERVPDALEIPGSHWGDEEAGLIKHTLFARLDTPVHSVLHEASHWCLMSPERRANLHTDAKGSAVEEMAVCYLQILLADLLTCMGRDRMFLDMDRWGYSFRVGSSREWFETDAEDALLYLTEKLSHAHSIPGLHVDTPGSRIL